MTDEVGLGQLGGIGWDQNRIQYIYEREASVTAESLEKRENYQAVVGNSPGNEVVIGK